jgi:flagellar protein FlgJ
MDIQFLNTAQSQMLEGQATAAKQRAYGASGNGAADHKVLRQTAEDFEAVFLSQMLQPMFQTVPTDGPMGGGPAEQIYRGMMVDEMGKSIAKSGGIGIADSVYREMLKMQEA